jgi:predicted transcriptional regulator
MKSVLISIQPKWCELIASGKKTVDVRKTRPKLEPPFKVYVYQTKHREHNGQTHSDGKVIGEFICDDITKILNFGTCFSAEGRKKCELNTIARSSCLDFADMRSYFGTTKEGYAWHISDLVIYEKPKELWEFAKPDKCPYNSPIGCTYGGHCYRAGRAKRCGDYVERPPQSWCYVEEGGE